MMIVLLTPPGIVDDKGLFEKYEYIKFDFNPKFAPTEFDPEWHEYDFKRK